MSAFGWACRGYLLLFSPALLAAFVFGDATHIGAHEVAFGDALAVLLYAVCGLIVAAENIVERWGARR